MGNAAVDQGFIQTLVRVLVSNVFSHDTDGHLILRMPDALHKVKPWLDVALLVFRFKQRRICESSPSCPKNQRHFVDVIHILRSNHSIFRNATEKGDLGFNLGRKKAVRTAQQNIRLNTDLSQFLYRMLCGLGLLFAGSLYVGHQRQMHEERVFPP